VARATGRNRYCHSTACACRSGGCSSRVRRRSATSASSPRPYVEGLRDAVDWFRNAGYLR
jgi:hypothetical protein